VKDPSSGWVLRIQKRSIKQDYHRSSDLVRGKSQVRAKNHQRKSVAICIAAARSGKNLRMGKAVIILDFETQSILTVQLSSLLSVSTSAKMTHLCSSSSGTIADSMIKSCWPTSLISPHSASTPPTPQNNHLY